MSFLVVPNVIADGLAADGSDLNDNFTAVTNWANGNVGNTNFSAAAADALARDKYATPFNVVKEVITASPSTASTFYVVGNFVPNTWVQVNEFLNPYTGTLQRISLWSDDMVGMWEWRLLVNGLPVGTTLTVTGAAAVQRAEQVQSPAPSIGAADVIRMEARRTSAGGADAVGRHVINMWSHINHQS